MMTVTVAGVKMKNFLFNVFLILCVRSTTAQFNGAQSHFSSDIDQRRQLSPQQQGHILSDIQNHQHRFTVNQQFPPQQFERQPIVQTTNVFSQQLPPGLHQQAFLNQPQVLSTPLVQTQPILSTQQTQPILPAQQNQQFFRNQPLPSAPSIVPIPSIQPSIQSIQNQPQQSQPLLPTVQTLNNKVVQHHTQTGFTPAYTQQNKFDPTTAPARSTAATNQQFIQASPSDGFSLDATQTSHVDPEKQKQRLKELREKQAIIDKHNQFVERQYEKALKKAQADHVDFVERQKELKKKLYQKLYRPPGSEVLRFTETAPRFIYPEEIDLFNLAVKKYYEEHPTTTTTTTTTTTPAPSTTESTKSTDDQDLYLQSSKSQLFSRIKTSDEKQAESSNNKKQFVFLPTALPASESKIRPIKTLGDLDELQKQYKSQLIRKDDLLTQLRLAIGEDPNIAKNLTSREISLANGQKVQLIKSTDPSLTAEGSELKTEEITLPNGQKIQVIKTSDPKITSGGTKEITLPDGRKAELIKADPDVLDKNLKPEEFTLPNGQKIQVFRTSDPSLVPGAKKVEPGSSIEKLILGASTTSTTAKPPKVVFEELTKGIVPPGANLELLKTDASGGLKQVDGIPTNLPSQKKVTFVLLEEQSDGSFKVQGVKGTGKEKSEIDVDSILKRIKNGEIKLPTKETAPSVVPFTEKDVITQAYATSKSDSDVVSAVTVLPNSHQSDDQYIDPPVLKTNIGTQFVSTPTASSRSYSPNTTPLPKITITAHEMPSSSSRYTSSNDLIRQASTASSNNHNSLYSHVLSSTYKPKTTSSPPSSVSIIQSQSVVPTTPQSEESEEDDIPQRKRNPELTDILKENGLFAMAKFLRQSGLDTILNETGPYTVFAPTDKAFRTLLVQLGGPEKADEKFRENPRLLSGLLLHHVIPGAFTIDSLQDEMTGVSLAGTQLRVNQYNMHDAEWNDIKVTTVNGAKVLDDKKDIEIPQGIAQAVDRVMFPLPVGDIVQTLQSDRERRFTNFLRALFSSGLAETLQGTKTFTLFAPTDKAFSSLTNEELTRTVSDRTLARDLVMRHITSGTLYTNGMRYYQIRNSLEPNKQVTISKQSGKVKINNIQIATQNIPATNGVIHAIDYLL